MLVDIKLTLAQCETCENFAASKPPPKSVIPRPDGNPYKQWAINMIDPMPQNQKDKKFIITAIDFTTRWPVAQAVHSHDSNTVRKSIGSQIVKKFGNPKSLLSDCGREFTSAKMNDYFTAKSEVINHLTNTPYHPQANGRVERLNGVLVDILRKLSVNDPSSWPDHLSSALMVICSRVNWDIGCSPFEDGVRFQDQLQQTLQRVSNYSSHHQSQAPMRVSDELRVGTETLQPKRLKSV